MVKIIECYLKSIMLFLKNSGDRGLNWPGKENNHQKRSHPIVLGYEAPAPPPIIDDLPKPIPIMGPPPVQQIPMGIGPPPGPPMLQQGPPPPFIPQGQFLRPPLQPF